MIYGIGTDILAIARISYLYQKYGEALPRRILSQTEWQDFSKIYDKSRFIAKRFAAKEAFSKAVGTGLCEPVSLRHISVGHTPQGRPIFICAPDLQQWLVQQQIKQIHLSMSDEKEHIVAFAIAETE